MDAKSLARSKRAHTQHLNKKHHPNPKSKPSQKQQQQQPADANAKAKKPPTKQPSSSSSSSSLPTNWGRYEDELDSSSLDSNAIRDDDVVVPKSKGADFAHLLSEAQSHSQLEPNTTTTTKFPSFDDVLPDFDQGMCSMLSVRGNGLLSWIGNDNFIVDDSSATSTEASFLSLDLHALATKLEKIDVSRRLFIEPDLLPQRQDVEELKKLSKLESEQRDNRASGISEQCLDGLSSLKLSDEERSDQCSSVVFPSTVTNSDSSFQDPFQGGVTTDRLRESTFSTTSTSGSSVLSSIELNSFVDQVKDKSIQIERLVEVGDSINMNTVDKPIDRKLTTFEALAAEAELDMLLNSFGETNLPKTAGVSNKPVYDVPISHWGDSTMSKANLSNQPPTKGPSSSTSALMNGDIDDTLDDLLRDTSITTKHNTASQQQETVHSPHVPASSSKPTGVLDDFDSWLDTI